MQISQDYLSKDSLAEFEKTSAAIREWQEKNFDIQKKLRDFTDRHEKSLHI
jgi:hypothetical protein